MNVEAAGRVNERRPLRLRAGWDLA